jgi:hypothetical protein
MWRLAPRPLRKIKYPIGHEPAGSTESRRSSSNFAGVREPIYLFVVVASIGTTCFRISGLRSFRIPVRSGLGRQLDLVSDQARRNGEQRTYGDSAHQDTHDRLSRSKQAPDWRKDNVSVAHGGVAGRREIQAGFPRSEASYTIKSCPQQNLHEVQENRHAGKPNHENGSLPEALCLDAKRKVSPHPMDEDSHSCTLDGERQGAEDGGRKSLAEKFHRSRQLTLETVSITD